MTPVSPTIEETPHEPPDGRKGGGDDPWTRADALLAAIRGQLNDLAWLLPQTAGGRMNEEGLTAMNLLEEAQTRLFGDSNTLGVCDLVGDDIDFGLDEDPQGRQGDRPAFHRLVDVLQTIDTLMGRDSTTGWDMEPMLERVKASEGWDPENDPAADWVFSYAKEHGMGFHDMALKALSMPDAEPGQTWLAGYMSHYYDKPAAGPAITDTYGPEI